MKLVVMLLTVGGMLSASAQDTTKLKSVRKPVAIFSSEKVVNANTPETVGKGKNGIQSHP
jgi:hypothetical protein